MSGIVPYYIVNEYPKSGGSWVGNMLSQALKIPFPRNRLPMCKSSILHGHMMHSWNMHNILIVWRDGRDILISQYYHSLFENERGNSILVKKSRKDLNFNDYNDIENNLSKFMEYSYERKKLTNMNWSEFVDKWADHKKCVHVKYEDLRLNPVSELMRIIKDLSGEVLDHVSVSEIVEEHSFKKLSGRKPGEESVNSFLRKGVIGDWKNYFDRRACEQFNQYAGLALLKLKYEFNGSWVESIK
jgi:hypothetical protein